MSVEIKDLRINVNVKAKDDDRKNFEQWRLDVIEECKRLIEKSLEQKRER